MTTRAIIGVPGLLGGLRPAASFFPEEIEVERTVVDIALAASVVRSAFGDVLRGSGLIAGRNVIADDLKGCDLSLQIGYWAHVVSLAIAERERSPRDFPPV